MITCEDGVVTRPAVLPGLLGYPACLITLPTRARSQHLRSGIDNTQPSYRVQTSKPNASVKVNIGGSAVAGLPSPLQ